MADIRAWLEVTNADFNAAELLCPIIKTLNFIAKLLISVQSAPVSVFDLRKVRSLFVEFKGEDVCGGDGGEFISRRNLYAILDEANVMDLLGRCVNILATYVTNYFGTYSHHHNDVFLLNIVTAIYECHRSLNLCESFDTKLVRREIETFLKYLIDVLANIDVTDYEKKYSLYVLTTRFIILLAHTQDTSAHVLDLIYCKLTRVHRFLVACKTPNPLDVGVIHGISYYVIIAKKIFGFAFETETANPKRFVPLFEDLKPHLPGYLQSAIAQCVALLEPPENAPGDV